MVSQTLELKHKQIRQEAAAEAATEATKETELKMLLSMKIEGMPKQAIVRIAKRQNIPEEEVNRILEDGQELE